MKTFVSFNEYLNKNDGATVSVLIFTLLPDHRNRYNLNNYINLDIKEKLEQYSFFSMYPDRLEDYKEIQTNEKKRKYAARLNSYIPQHVKKVIDKLDGKKNFIYYQQFHLDTI